MKNEKNYVGFLITKIWQILKRFCRALSQRLVQPNSKYVASLGLDILKSVDSDKNRTKESF